MKMKKILAVLLCIAMMLSMSGLTVFAEGETGNLGSGRINIDNPERTYITVELYNQNAKESIKLEIYDANDNLIATTVATEKTVALNATTISVFTGINTTDPEWWTTTWITMPNENDVPAKTVLYIDDVKVDEGEILMKGATSNADIEWSKVNGVFGLNKVEAENAMTEGELSAQSMLITFNNVPCIDKNMTVQLYHDDELLSTTNATAKRIGQAYEALTTNVVYSGDAAISGSWTTEINASWTIDRAPNKIVVDIDGTKTTFTNFEIAAFSKFEKFDLTAGTITPGYTSNTDIWGELSTNAKNSVEILIYAGDKKIAKTNLNNVDGIIDGDIDVVTWHNNFVGNFDKYWTTEWYDNNPSVDTVPTKVVLVADGVKVAENEVQMNAPDNLDPVKWEEIEAVRSSLPNAIVENLGAITVDKYRIWNGSFIQGGEPINLPVAMEFVAKDTVEEAQKNAYADYTTDFFIEIDGLSGETLDTTGCYLAGNYGDWGWIKIPLDGIEVKKGVIYPILSKATPFNFKYVDICSDVKKFYCGMYLSDKVLDENPDIKVTLSLGLSETLEKAQAGDFITVDKAYTYGYADFKNEKPEIASYSATDAGYYKINGEKSGLIRFLFGFDTEETNIETGVRFIKDEDITAQVGETKSGTSKAFSADITGIKESSDKTYYAVAFLKVNPDTDDEKVYWSEVSSCTPNFERFFGTKEQ